MESSKRRRMATAFPEDDTLGVVFSVVPAHELISGQLAPPPSYSRTPTRFCTTSTRQWHSTLRSCRSNNRPRARQGDANGQDSFMSQTKFILLVGIQQNCDTRGVSPQPRARPSHYLTCLRKVVATVRARLFTASFMAEISESICSMNSMMKSTNLCFHISSQCTFVIRKLKS